MLEKLNTTYGFFHPDGCGLYFIETYEGNFIWDKTKNTLWETDVSLKRWYKKVNCNEHPLSFKVDNTLHYIEYFDGNWRSVISMTSRHWEDCYEEDIVYDCISHC